MLGYKSNLIFLIHKSYKALICNKFFMKYHYVEKIGGTDNGIHPTCPKCGSQEVVLTVLEDGRYGVESCNKCEYKDYEVKEILNGKID